MHILEYIHGDDACFINLIYGQAVLSTRNVLNLISTVTRSNVVNNKLYTKKLPPKGNTCTHQVGIPGAPTTTHATQANALRRLKLQSALESRLGIKDLQEHETELTYG